MPIDTFLKKYFTAVVLGLVALAAYFQASGVTQLFGSALTLEPSDVAGEAPVSRRTSRSERPSAKPILDRNPFDSVTGPLSPNATPISLPTPEPVKIDDPLRVPACDGVTVHIVTESDDPLWSFAAVQGPGEQSPVFRRVGDDVGGKKIAFIGYNPLEASPAIWLEDSGLCQAFLFGEPTAGKAAGPAAKPQPSKTPAHPSGTSKGRQVDPDIASKIKKISDSEFHVDRGVVDKILENQAELMRSARIVPEQKDGKVVGIRLFGIRPDTLLGTLGMQNGDRLESINGFDMGSPEKALEAYARLRSADNLNVKLNRRGKSMNIDYRIK